INAGQRMAAVRRDQRTAVQQVGGSHCNASEELTDAVEATGHLVGEPLPESAAHAEIEPTHQPDVAAMDLKTPDYEEPATTGEAPAEFALIDEIIEPPEAAEVRDAEPPPFV